MTLYTDISEDLKKLRQTHRSFYITAYASTDATANRYHCGGGLDLGLNEEGLESARSLSRRFQKNPLKIKKTIASPELRAVQLADFFHDVIKGRIVIYPEWRDQVLGALEGQPIDQGDTHQPPQGETFIDFSVRIHQGLLKLLQEPEVTLVTTHPRVMRKIFDWLGLENEPFEHNTVYAVDLPAQGGKAHFRAI